MATQYADITPLSFPAAPIKPNIRIAFVAGPAVQAVNDELAKLPDPTRTLDEMVQPGLADRIEQVTTGLSGAMRHAFRRWLDVGLRFEATPDDDDDALAVASDLRDDAIRGVMEIPAITDGDFLLKAHIWAIDAGSTSTTSFGPIDGDDNVSGFRADMTPIHIGRDLLARSPLSVVLNDMANMSKPTPPFDFREALARVDDDAWSAQYRDAVAAVEAMHAYERDFIKPLNAIHEQLGANGLDQSGTLTIVVQREEEFGRFCSKAYQAIDGLFHMRMPNFDALRLAVELAQIAPMDLCDDNGHLILGVAKSIDRLSTGDSAGMVSRTFATLRSEMIAGRDRCTDDAEAILRVDRLEEGLATTPAATLNGVIAKLRVAFQHRITSAWGDMAIVDPTCEEFKEGLRTGDLYEQMFWSGIEDLARIAGVNLKEQGA